MDVNAYYETATKRNIGIVSLDEQQRLRGARVAIVGMGGGGGIYLTTLVRMGIGKFNIADFDDFSTVNVNRQAGAMSSTVGCAKVRVMARIARDIHPGVEIGEFSAGVSAHNIDAFLRDVDIVVDALDAFAIPARRLLYGKAREKGIPVVSGVPPGLSATLIVFMPDGPSFEDYFDIRDGMTPLQVMAAFIVGLTPAGTHWSYYDASHVEPSAQAAPSSAASIALLAGLVTTEVLVILLKRRAPMAVPAYCQFDAYKGVYKKGRLWWCNRGPLQRFKRWLIVRKFRPLAEQFNSAGLEPLPADPEYEATAP